MKKKIDYSDKDFGVTYWFNLPSIVHQLAKIEPYIKNYISEMQNKNREAALENYNLAVQLLCWITRDPRWTARGANREIERAWEVLRDCVLNSSKQFNDSTESLYGYFNDYARVVKREQTFK